MISELKLSNSIVVNARAEDAAHDSTQREQYDVAIARAVAEMPTLSEYLLPFVKIGGLAIAMKSQNVQAEIDHAEAAIKTLGGQFKQIVPVIIPGGGGAVTAGVLASSKADQTELLLTGHDSSLTRFANNVIHQNVAETNAQIRVRVAFGKRVGVAGFGLGAHRGAQIMLAKLGLNPDTDVTMLQIGGDPLEYHHSDREHVRAGVQARTQLEALQIAEILPCRSWRATQPASKPTQASNGRISAHQPHLAWAS